MKLHLEYCTWLWVLNTGWIESYWSDSMEEAMNVDQRNGASVQSENWGCWGRGRFWGEFSAPSST